MISKTLLWGMLAASLGYGQTPSVSVQLIDTHGVREGIKSAAQKDAARIFAAAGVRLDWQEAASYNGLGPGLAVKLVSQKVAIAGGDPLGYAFLSPPFRCNCAQIVYPELERADQRWEGGISNILGAALAHELGHLVFNSNAHSSTGIMTANFGHKEIVQAGRGELLFTAEQARSIRSNVALQCCAAGRDPGDNRNEPLPAITLRVINEARVDEQVVRKAREEVYAMLGRAGVGLVWVDCGASAADSNDREPCQRARGGADFWLRLTNDRPAWTSKENLGFTELAGGDGSSGVYYPAVVKSAQRFTNYSHGIAPLVVFTPYFLGAAIVHEVGHLILGANAHTSSGVMCAEWGAEQLELVSQGKLNFARDQVKPFQIEVRRRLSEGASPKRP